MSDPTSRRRCPRVIVVAVFILAVAGAGAIGIRLRANHAPLQNAFAVAAARDIMGTGTIESVAEANLAFDIHGRISWLGVDEGDVVKAGDLLARLDDSHERRSLEVAEAGRAVAVADADGAAADVAKGVATRDRWKADFVRAERLYKAGAMSGAEFDQIAEHYKTSEAEVRATEAANGRAAKYILTAERAVGLERVRTDDTLLRSPFDGVIVRRLREVGDVPSAGEPIFSVISLKKIWARAWVDESALAELKEGQAARAELRSHPGRYFRGRIDRIGRQVDRQTHELLVDIELLERPERLAVGARVDVWMAPAKDGTRVGAANATPGAMALSVR